MATAPSTKPEIGGVRRTVTELGGQDLAEAWGRDEGVKRVYMPELRPCAIRTGEYDGGPAREATHFDPFGLDGAGCR